MRRSEMTADAEFMAHPRLSPLERLVARVRETGLKTKRTVNGDGLDVLEGAQLVAYRSSKRALASPSSTPRGRVASNPVAYTKPAIEIEVPTTATPGPKRRHLAVTG